MSKTCSVCPRPDVEGINLALSQGSSHSTVARSFGLSKGTVQRHSKCAQKRTAKAERTTATLPPLDASASEVAKLKAQVQGIIEATSDEKIRIAAFRELRGYLELEARLQQEAQGTSSLTSQPAFQILAATLARTLQTFPDAQAAIESAVMEATGSPLLRLTCSKCSEPLTEHEHDRALATLEGDATP